MLDQLIYLLDLTRQVFTHPETKFGAYLILGIILAMLFFAEWLGEVLGERSARQEIENNEDRLKSEIDRLELELDTIDHDHELEVRRTTDAHERRERGLKAEVYGQIDATTEAARLYLECMQEKNEDALAEKVSALHQFVIAHPKVHMASVRVVCNVRDSDWNDYATADRMVPPNLVQWGRDGKLMNESEHILLTCPPELLAALLQDRTCARHVSGTHKGQLLNQRTIAIHAYEASPMTQTSTLKPTGTYITS